MYQMGPCANGRNDIVEDKNQDVRTAERNA